MEELSFQDKLKLYANNNETKKKENKKHLPTQSEPELLKKENTVKDLLSKISKGIEKIQEKNRQIEQKKINFQGNNLKLKVDQSLLQENSLVNNDKENNDQKEEVEEIEAISLLPELPPKDYSDVVSNKPDEIFSDITMETVDEWTKILSEGSNQTSNDDLNAQSIDLLTPDIISIIKKDVLRSRVKESVLVPNFKEELESTITFYCRKNGIKYKQGLNEIISVILLLKHKLPLSSEQIYNLVHGFVGKYLTNYYKEQTLFALKSSMNLVTILLKYHLPWIYNLFEYCSISPEMYSTSWIMTTFSSKLRLDVIYYLWNKIIRINDNLIPHYIMIAIFEVNSDKITQEDPALIPSVISRLTIETKREVDIIIHSALEMRKKTPFSFRILANNLQIFTKNSTQLKECFEKYKPESNDAMPIFPSEILYICYNKLIKCPDELCDNYNENSFFGTWEKPENFQCELCDMKVKKEINFILLDLRILETNSKEKDRTGFLPATIMADQEELREDDFADTIGERYQKDKGNFHFVFITSKTDDFRNFEDKYYTDKDKYSKNSKNMMSMMDGKIDKELDIQEANRTTSPKEMFELKEYDNLKKTLEFLLKANFPYISYVYGGYSAVHDLARKYQINLLEHEKKCHLCREIRHRNKANRKKKNEKVDKKKKN